MNFLKKITTVFTLLLGVVLFLSHWLIETKNSFMDLANFILNIKLTALSMNNMESMIFLTIVGFLFFYVMLIWSVAETTFNYLCEMEIYPRYNGAYDNINVFCIFTSALLFSSIYKAFWMFIESTIFSINEWFYCWQGLYILGLVSIMFFIMLRVQEEVKIRKIDVFGISFVSIFISLLIALLSTVITKFSQNVFGGYFIFVLILCFIIYRATKNIWYSYKNNLDFDFEIAPIKSFFATRLTNKIKELNAKKIKIEYTNDIIVTNFINEEDEIIYSDGSMWISPEKGYEWTIQELINNLRKINEYYTHPFLQIIDDVDNKMILNVNN